MTSCLKDRKVYLYTLEDPVTGEIRYVGKTVQNIKNRLSSHISKAKYDGRKSHVYCWIKSLLNDNKLPVVALLDVVKEEEWEEEERFYITYFKSLGFQLTNNSEGGDAGPIGARWTCKNYTIRANKPIVQYTLKGEIVKEWLSTREFARYYNMKFGKAYYIVTFNTVWKNYLFIKKGEAFTIKNKSYKDLDKNLNVEKYD